MSEIKLLIGVGWYAPRVAWLMLKVKIFIQLGDCLFFAGLPHHANLCWDAAAGFNNILREALED